jgi:hypothetical protein
VHHKHRQAELEENIPPLQVTRGRRRTNDTLASDLILDSCPDFALELTEIILVNEEADATEQIADAMATQLAPREKKKLCYNLQ